MGQTLCDFYVQSRLPRLEQFMLWQEVLGVERSWLIAHDTDVLPAEAVQRYQSLERRRLLGEPMAYLIGWREFMGHRFTVTPSVLIPRPDTETLVEQVLASIRDLRSPQVLDLGTGSGAVAISIALARPDATVVATDLCSDALEVAQQNAQSLCGKVEFLQGSWYDALLSHTTAFDMIVSNPPYIAQHDPHLTEGDVQFEPRSALTDGADGLHDLRAIISEAPCYLKASASLWVEHGWDQAAAVRHLLQQAGFSDVRSQCDLAGIERISGGIR